MLKIIGMKKRNISNNEELTLDYAQFLDENMEPFHCKCNSVGCRGLIVGIKNNSLTERELEMKVSQDRQ